jgi:hypothetical protein
MYTDFENIILGSCSRFSQQHIANQECYEIENMINRKLTNTKDCADPLCSYINI